MSTFKVKARSKRSCVVSVGDLHLLFDGEGYADCPVQFSEQFGILDSFNPGQYEIAQETVASSEEIVETAVIEAAEIPAENSESPTSSPQKKKGSK